MYLLRKKLTRFGGLYSFVIDMILSVILGPPCYANGGTCSYLVPARRIRMLLLVLCRRRCGGAAVVKRDFGGNYVFDVQDSSIVLWTVITTACDAGARSVRQTSTTRGGCF